MKKILLILEKFLKIHIKYQVDSGAQIIQIFDSWAGSLETKQFAKYVVKPIKKIISDNNLSNSEFAEKIGIPKSSVTHLLSERNNPSLDVIIKISETFEHISTDYLIFGYENDTETPSEPLNNLFDDLDEKTSEDSVKDSNNNIKSIILIYENNKFEQIDKIKD